MNLIFLFQGNFSAVCLCEVLVAIAYQLGRDVVDFPAACIESA